MDIYSTQRSETSALIQLSDPSAVKIQGTLRGPYCRYGRTLPSTFRVADDGTATVVDPCYWSPRMPFYYQVDVHYEDGDGVARSETFRWGMRRLEVHRDDLRLDGRRYVIRAIEDQRLGVADLPQLRELSCALFSRDPDETLCEKASELGVLLIVELSVDLDTESQLCRWGRYPAVGIGVVTDPSIVGPRVAHDIIRAANCHAGSATIPSGADVVICTENDVTSVLQQTGSGKPILVRRQHGSGLPRELRAECDRLQRDLARLGQFAGYMITVDG